MKKGCLISIAVFLGLLFIAALLPSTDDKSAKVDDGEEKTEQTQVKPEKSTNWIYKEEIDEMTDSKTKYAMIISDNEEEFDFPYQGGSKLTLTIRQSKKYGLDAYIRISSGQFINNEYSGQNKISVRFDDEKPLKYTMLDPSDVSQDVLFVRDAKGFIKKCKEAKIIRIEPQFFQEGCRVFTFTTPIPLEWD